LEAANLDLNPILAAAPKNLQANYLRAYELDKQGKFTDADQILDRISGDFSGFPAGYFLQGGTKFALGQYAVAEAILAKYVALTPNDAKAVRLIAITALRQGAPARAIEYLKPLVDKGSAEAATLTVLGNAYMASRKPDLALQQFEKAAALDPENPQIQTDVAVSEMGVGQSDKGLAELERVFESKAGAAVAGPTLVLTEIRAGHVDKATAAAHSLADGNTQNPLYQTLLGVATAAQRDYPAAEAALRKAVELEPGFAPAAQNLARLYLALNRPDDAVKVYENLLAKAPDNVMALLGLTDVLIAQKKWHEAETTVTRARTAAPNDPAPGLKLVTVYMAQQDWKSAQAVAAELSAQFSQNLDILDAQARAQVAAGDQGAAVGTYRRAYEIAPDSIPILSRYLRLLVAAKDWPTAKSVLQKAIDRVPGNTALKADMIRVIAEADGVDAAVAKAQSYAYADPASDTYDLISADLYDKAGRKTEVQAVLEKATNLRPTDAPLAIALSAFYSRQGDPVKAEAVLKDRLKADPDDLPIATALGSFYMGAKNYDAAVTQYSHVLEKNGKDAVALNNLAWLYQQKGDLPKARNFAERAAAAAPSAPQIDDTLGWILLAQGETDKAVGYLTTANRAAPREPEIQYHLAVALQRAGRSDDAQKMLDTLIGSGVSFTDRAEAQKLLDQLKRG